MSPDAETTEVLTLREELEARDKTVAVLIRRVEQEQARRASGLAVLEQNVALERALRRQSGQLEDSHGHLEQTLRELKLAHSQLLESKKLEAVGQLAAGVAHEINTPIQFAGDNATFLQAAFQRLIDALDASLEVVRTLSPGEESPELVRLNECLRRAKIDWLRTQIPAAVEQCLEGIQRVATIVGAMKEFSHPSADEMQQVNLHEAIQSTVTVARNEWKYVAELELDFDPELPLVPCLRNQFNQVILNLIVNAAHAISDKTRGGAAGKGLITIATRRTARHAEIQVRDTGGGIPERIMARVYDPFFTTKPVGKGTGQGLAIARSVIVDKHGGGIRFETQPGEGTTFFVLLPLERAAEAAVSASELEA